MVFRQLNRSQKILLAGSVAIIQAVALSFDTALAQTQTHSNLNKKCSGSVKISYAFDRGDRDVFQDLHKEKSLEVSNLDVQPNTYFGQPKISEGIYQIDSTQKLNERPFLIASWCCPCPNPFRACCYC